MNHTAVTLTRSLIKLSIRLLAVVVVATIILSVVGNLATMLCTDVGLTRFFHRPVTYAYYHMGLRVGASWLVLAALLFIFQNQIARFLVPRATRACLECGYDLRSLKASRCPECGTDIPPTPAAGK